MLPIDPSVIWREIEEPMDTTARADTAAISSRITNKTTNYFVESGPYLFPMSPPPPPPPSVTLPPPQHANVEEEKEEEKQSDRDEIGDLAAVVGTLASIVQTYTPILSQKAKPNVNEEEAQESTPMEEEETVMQNDPTTTTTTTTVTDMETDDANNNNNGDDDVDDDDGSLRLIIDFKESEEEEDVDEGQQNQVVPVLPSQPRDFVEHMEIDPAAAAGRQIEINNSKFISKICAGDKGKGENVPSESMDVGGDTDIVGVPLLDYLCAFMHCTPKELQVLFNNLEARKRMLIHLRTVRLQTSHLRPPDRNLQLHAHDLSAQNANLAFALGGYLSITVRQYYYVKHGRRLSHPYLPCLIEFGGGSHASYYPLEVVSVLVSHTTPPSHHHILQRGCHHCCEMGN
jgi:hypothetical protein